MRTSFLFTSFGAALFLGASVAVAAPTSTENGSIQSLQKQVDNLEARFNQIPMEVKPSQDVPVTTENKGKTSLAPFSVMANSDIQLYGHLDVSLDYMDKGIKGRTIGAADASNPNPGTPYQAAGNGGGMMDVSSNLSFFGIRGSHPVNEDLKAVFQIETQVEIAATPGTADNNASADNGVKAGLGSRNSFVGLSSPIWGSIKLGKTDTPYKSSTGKLDPFSATVGDYNAIVGNTGGDNRAEFDLRLSHSIWYESPNWSGLTLNVLYSPGQNRDPDNGNIAAGEPSCTGGNNPIGGGKVCGDGSFGDAWSVATNFTQGNFFGTLATELHRSTNRTGDELAQGGGAPDGSLGAADEWGTKAAIQYTFSSMTTVDLIWEKMTRYSPGSDYNERTRSGSWLAVSQKISAADTLNLGWGHAGKTLGDPGDPGVVDPNGMTSAGPKDNEANLYSLGYQHAFQDKKTMFYAVYAMMKNQSGAHYDLGASGHGILADCHDASAPAGGFNGGGGICFTGSTLQAFSVGLTHEF